MEELFKLSPGDFLKHLTKSYNLERDSYYPDRETYKKAEYNQVRSELLDEAFRGLVGDDWYGFDLGVVPNSWHDIISDLTEYLNQHLDGLVLQQIKVKFGGLRYYYTCGKTNDKETVDKMYSLVTKVENLLYDQSMIY